MSNSGWSNQATLDKIICSLTTWISPSVNLVCYSGITNCKSLSPPSRQRKFLSSCLVEKLKTQLSEKYLELLPRRFFLIMPENSALSSSITERKSIRNGKRDFDFHQPSCLTITVSPTMRLFCDQPFTIDTYLHSTKATANHSCYHFSEVAYSTSTITPLLTLSSSVSHLQAASLHRTYVTNYYSISKFYILSRKFP
jgi:hypothetical protein